MVRARKPNRTDLAGDTAPSLPVTAVPNQPYGEAGQQRAAQKAVPMGTPATPTAVPVASVSRQPSPPAGSLPFLEPTQRPHEPITAGLPFGPGPGPEVMNSAAPMPSHPVTDSLNQIAAAHQDGAVGSLADAARLMGL